MRKIPLSFAAAFLPSSAPDLWREGTLGPLGSDTAPVADLRFCC